MLAPIESVDPNLVLTSLCQLLIGLGITCALAANLYHLGEEMTLKTTSEKNAFISTAVFLSGLMAAILCFLSDFLYYLNRNALVWPYVLSSAFPCGFLFVNALLHHTTAKCFPVTSTINLNASLSNTSSKESKESNK